MLTQKTRIISVSLPVALAIFICSLALSATRASAQCPNLTTEGATSGVTRFSTVKSQMWFNDGIWWGAFSDNSTGIHFYALAADGTATHGAMIDGNISGVPDALWDGTNLFVLVWKSSSLSTLYKYSYDSNSKTYSLIAGFPVNLTLSASSNSGIVLEKDTTGKLWATYTGTQSNGLVHVIWSTSADHKVWDTNGIVLESGLTNTTEVAAITKFGTNNIGIAWSNQSASEMAFRYHVDGHPETVWSTKELIDSGLGPRGLGSVVDDHMSMKAAPDGRIFLVAKDNDNDGTPGHDREGRIWLYIRSTAGVWGQKTIIQPDISQQPTRPVLLLDTTNKAVYVIYNDESATGLGRNFIAHTGMDIPSFDAPCVFTVTASTNLTSTKQNVTGSSGLMAASSSSTTSQIIFRGAILSTPNPVPTVNSALPAGAVTGDAGFSLFVNGSEFVNGSVVRFNGSDRPTTFVSATELTAQITSADLATSGTFPITVFNPAPAGGTSGAVDFTVNNPAPALTSTLPTSKTAGSAAFTLTCNGGNFVVGAVVRLNGNNRPTTFVSATQLTAQITAADIQAAAVLAVTVVNPAPGGGSSVSIDFTVNNPTPVLNNLSSSSAAVGDPGFTVAVNGSNFVSGSVVRFKGQDRVTSSVSGTQLAAQITAADFASAGTFPVIVFNPAPGGGSSSTLNFTVNNPAPILSNIAPTSKTAGDSAFTLTVNGLHFNSSSIVDLNGTARTTSFVNANQLTAQITAADLASAGTPSIAVFNPAPGGGTSTSSTLTVNNPGPTLTGISPTSKTAGDPAFTLTVNGSNFINGSIVRLSGSDRVTSFVGSTQLTAQITAADLQVVGTFSITVSNPTPGGGTSSAASLTVNNPVPALTGLSQTSKVAGDAAFTMTLTGTNFVAGSVVRFNGNNRNTTFVSATQLTAQITTADLQVTGTFPIMVFNPTPGGGSSGPINFTVNSSAPILSSISPTSKTAGDAAFALAVNGVNFNSNSVVRFNGSDRVTNFVSTTQLIAQFTAADVQAAAIVPITVFSPSPGGGTSAPNNLTVNNPIPTQSSISPASRTAGDAAFALTVNGDNFNSSSVVRFNGSDRTTTLVNANQVIAQITAADVQTVGTFPIAVFNPAPGGGTSAPSTFTVNTPVPTLASISPTSKIAGDSAFTLTATGTNFVAGSVVRFNGINRSTTFVNATRLTAQITAADVAIGGAYPVTVLNPTPGGGSSNPLSFTVDNPAPILSSIAPTSKTAGDPAFTLTVNGLNFNSSSVVRFDGSDRPTMFVSGTQLTAQITAADVQAAGIIPITVFAPAPGGGTSATASLTVNNPPPTLSSILPTSKIAGDAAFSLSVSGNNFVNGSVVRLNGDDRVTTFVSSTELTAQITAADIQTAAVFTISVFNSTPGGGSSSALNFTVNNPTPVLNSLSSSSALAGTGGFALTVNGSKFVNGSVVRFNGGDRPTSFISSSELTVQITTIYLQTAGTLAITAFNPAPGGGSSGALDFTVNNPAPALNSISPAGKTAGDAAFVLTVGGANFNSSSVVLWNGQSRTTSFVSESELTAQISAADISAAGTVAVTVNNPAPGGGTTAPGALTISNPAPTLATIAPTTTIAGDAAFTLTVSGTNFNKSSAVLWNGQARPTSFVSDTQLTAQITAADISAAGTVEVAVNNPVPGGGTTSASALTINNPLPALTTIAPASRIAGDATFTLTVNGTNLNASSIVRFNGSDRPTTFANATQLSAQITAADVQAAGTFAVTIFNPAPGGGLSGEANFTVNNPLPDLTTISPSSETAGEASFSLTVNGTNFNSASIVRLNGGNRLTTFVNTTQLTAQITAADVASAGTRSITVFNPTPGGGLSGAVELTVNNPAPTLTAISQSSKTVGDAAFTLAVDGTNFNSASIIRFSGSDRTTTFISASQLTVQITAADLGAGGTFPVTVFNPAPGGGSSGAVDLTVNNPTPTISSLSTTSALAGGTAFTLTINGTNFVNGSVARFNGNDRPTAFVNGAQLTTQITAADIQTAGVFPVTVVNSAPGGGNSGAVDFTVNNPGPALNSVSPSSVVVGSAGFTLTVNGSNYVNGSVIRLNGSNRPTTVVSSSKLTTQITAADIHTAAVVNVTVVNPAPGGGSSNAVDLTVNNPTPVLNNISSSGGMAGDPAFTLTVGGSNFVNGSVVRFNGSARITNFVSGSQLTAQITPADLAIGGTFPVTVFNQAPGGGSSNPMNFTIIWPGFEADVAPRPNGSNTGTLSVADYVLMGEFAAGLETPSDGSEFQRADCSPKETLGDGRITISDWVQTGIYVVGLDPVVRAGGPTEPLALGAAKIDGSGLGSSTPEGPVAVPSTVRFASAGLPVGQTSSIAVKFDTQGGENALGFSLMFDPAKFTFVSAQKGADASIATLNVNRLQATNGRVGMAMAMPTGESFTAGTHEVVVLTFTALGNGQETPQIGFTDQPIAREVVDVHANSVKAIFRDEAAPGVNPIDDAHFFVQQHYLDFLNRTPDGGGLDYWTQQITQCGTDATCIRQRRIDVSAAFFVEQEFQQTGYVIYRLYRAAYGVHPTYVQFVADRSQLVGGPQLPASTLEFANQFVGATAFKQAYPDSMAPGEFVSKLFDTAGLAPYSTERQQATQALTNGSQSRAQVLLDLIETKELKDREYNSAFVLMQYFGYLRRDPDQAGYEFWLSVLNSSEAGNYRGMVCAFITSREYQERFGSVVTHTNQDCGSTSVASTSSPAPSLMLASSGPLNVSRSPSFHN